MVGTGNDFIMVDNRSGDFPAQNSDVIGRLCDRRKGVGADGIILLEDSTDSDFRMRILNPDGSEAEMCGNGVRCAVQFAADLGMVNQDMSVETIAGKLRAQREGDQIRINMGKPKDLKNSFQLLNDNHNWECFFVNTGVPHVVTFVDDVALVDVQKIGRWVRFHDQFKPSGTNCNFVEIKGPNQIRVRTYERGVENETFSCGTGTCASAVIAVIERNLKWPIISKTVRGENLKVDSTLSRANPFQNFFLIGPVDLCFSGQVAL